MVQNLTTDRLDFFSLSSSLFFITADASSSGGAFVGDYLGDGINQFSFDLTINPGSSVSELFFEITNLTEGETWQYALTLPAFGTNTSFLVPLSGAGWTQTSGDENFAFILGQTEEISIVLGSATAGNVSGSIDNFASIPEPSTTIIAALGLLTAISRRRRQDV
ncbi:MAG: PEP-CTERM sorting domain-containing protein [Akkermansiaceae bacterium]|nr:PEP-CTERM sorting domain-containing protein [Akkermansiaceae bacterium]